MRWPSTLKYHEKLKEKDIETVLIPHYREIIPEVDGWWEELKAMVPPRLRKPRVAGKEGKGRVSAKKAAAASKKSKAHVTHKVDTVSQAKGRKRKRGDGDSDEDSDEDSA